MPTYKPEIGSIWRKWDLHIHTPLSIKQEYGGPDRWDLFLENINNLPSDVNVIGLNDYYFIDGYEHFMKEYWFKGKVSKNILKVFPLLEFRIDTFGSANENKFTKINLHVLFDIKEDEFDKEILRIRNEFIDLIPITKLAEHKTKKLSRDNFIELGGDLSEGFKSLIPSTDKLFDLIDSLTWKSKIFTFLGFAEWNSLDKGDQLKLVKTDLYKRTNAFFTASDNDLEKIRKKENILKIFGDKKVFHSLDIHKFDKFYNYTCWTWIKANPTFQGLKQVFNDPEERLWVDEKPLKLIDLEKNKQFYIEKLNIISSKPTDNKWFDKQDEISFNPGLITIIGNKGSGKSALADIIASTCNSKNKSFSFLNDQKFLLLRKEPDKYSANIHFYDNYNFSKCFIDAKNKNSDEPKVIYLSQSFVNTLCDTIEDISELEKEINRVIFEHIPTTDNLDSKNIQELINKRSSNIDKEIQIFRNKVNLANNDIIIYEDLLKPEYKEKIEKARTEVKRQIDEFQKNPPAKVDQPKDEIKDEINKTLKSNFDKINDNNQKKREIESRLSNNNNNLQELIDIKDKFGILENDINDLKLLIDKNIYLNSKNIKGKDLITYSIEKEVIGNEIDLLKKESIKNTDELNALSKSNTELKDISDNLTKGLTEEQKRYQDYIKSKGEWEKSITDKIGDSEAQNTLKYYEKIIKNIDRDYKTALIDSKKQRKEYSYKIVDKVIEKKEFLNEIYGYTKNKIIILLDEYKESTGLDLKTKDFIDFNIKIELLSSFKDNFFDYIHRNRKGTFYGDSDSYEQLDLILRKIDFTNLKIISSLPDEILDALNYNLQVDPNKTEPNIIESQLREGKKKIDLYNFIYGFEYLEPKYGLSYNGKDIKLLSPGEKGLLLINFYLLIDIDKRPIIIDQPEENLDNETVYNRLVSFIKYKKKERQIIIVTHNPNLAVVCDSEQIIYCHMNKSNNKNLITYISGGIEDETIKKHILDVLEGTEPAFNNRKSKYNI